MTAAVTPGGVRDGDPAALAGLCAARGPSVLAYCRHVAGDAEAGAAAADAFARFRADVVATRDLGELDPEAVLINATRRAAASRAPHAAVGVCAVVPLLLVARADGTLTESDREILDSHLQSCWACRAPVERFRAAERAYRDPPDPATAMDPVVIAQIIAAMAAAAPIHGTQPAPAPAANGSAQPSPAVAAEPVAVASAAAPSGPPDQPTQELRAAAAPDPMAVPVPAPVALPSASADGGAAPAGRRPRRGAVALPRRKAPAPPAYAVLPRGRARGRRGASRPTRARRLPLILPIAVVLAGLVLALFVSGVLGGSDPASSPRVNLPADAPSDGTPADVVVVPGASDASAADVEEAKARARARAKRQREAADDDEPAPAASRATAPAAAATRPPVAAPPPPPPPPAARTGGNAGSGTSGGSRRIDAGNGATGSEQIPPAEDTSTVPDLAPPPETATPAP